MAWYLGAGWRRFYTQSNPKPVWEPQKNAHPKMKNKLTMFRCVSLVNRSSAESLCLGTAARGAPCPPHSPVADSGARMRSGVVQPVTLGEPPGGEWEAERRNTGAPPSQPFDSLRFLSFIEAQQICDVFISAVQPSDSVTHTHPFPSSFPFGVIAGYWMQLPGPGGRPFVILVYNGSHLPSPGAQSSPPQLAISALGSFDLLLLSPRTSPETAVYLALRGSPANLNPLHQGGHLTCQGKTRGSQQTLSQGGTRMSAPRALVERDSVIPPSLRRKQTKSKPSSAVSPGGGAPFWMWEAASFSGHLWYKIFDSSRHLCLGETLVTVSLGEMRDTQHACVYVSQTIPISLGTNRTGNNTTH